ncbi:basic salivary proline-rich protein 1-like [Chroicocephalus ridibundus]|uniref:basic salivary proline-rich protein 1-like n=1 Tax=Chroicocephalus ridibundus TaxID=1192867 RepID=UPI002FDDE792
MARPPSSGGKGSGRAAAGPRSTHRQTGSRGEALQRRGKGPSSGSAAAAAEARGGRLPRPRQRVPPFLPPASGAERSRARPQRSRRRLGPPPPQQAGGCAPRERKGFPRSAPAVPPPPFAAADRRAPCRPPPRSAPPARIGAGGRSPSTPPSPSHGQEERGVAQPASFFFRFAAPRAAAASARGAGLHRGRGNGPLPPARSPQTAAPTRPAGCAASRGGSRSCVGNTAGPRAPTDGAD